MALLSAQHEMELRTCTATWVGGCSFHFCGKRGVGIYTTSKPRRRTQRKAKSLDWRGPWLSETSSRQYTCLSVTYHRETASFDGTKYISSERQLCHLSNVWGRTLTEHMTPDLNIAVVPVFTMHGKRDVCAAYARGLALPHLSYGQYRASYFPFQYCSSCPPCHSECGKHPKTTFDRSTVWALIFFPPSLQSWCEAAQCSRPRTSTSASLGRMSCALCMLLRTLRSPFAMSVEARSLQKRQGIMAAV
ncbi:hypothetical protein BJY01DRAFT_123558 [Aspergillus pseudoustus]|uniref:Uncharacterized protein n=1 Tax=Aspergillus pseudoustus TaxID=1810923 RepID=A0ABR4IPB1_9EURO